MDHYPHQPFSTSTDIRVLVLLPGKDGDPVRVNLLHTDLASSHHHEYEAISYTWGSSTNEQTILAGDTPVKIRYNLWSFLKRLRRTSEVRHLWCDALCISQHDLKEKSEQVRMIGSIFTKADRVLVWVGEHADGSAALFENRRRSQSRLQKRHQRSDRISMVAEWSAFLNRPYWSRAWIIQEIILARNVVLHCGRDQMEWDKFVPTWTKIWGRVVYLKSRNLSEEFERLTARLTALNVERTMHHAERLLRRFDFYIFPSLGESILGVSRKFSDSDCLDPRDKVFAFLSLERRPSVFRHYLVRMSLMKEIEEIYPDYESEPVDLFIRVSSTRLIRGHLPRHATRYIVALLTNLRLGSRDGQKVAAFLLDAADRGQIPRSTIVTMTSALGECGMLKNSSIRSKGSWSSVRWPDIKAALEQLRGSEP